MPHNIETRTEIMEFWLEPDCVMVDYLVKDEGQIWHGVYNIDVPHAYELPRNWQLSAATVENSCRLGDVRLYPIQSE